MVPPEELEELDELLELVLPDEDPDDEPDELELEELELELEELELDELELPPSHIFGSPHTVQGPEFVAGLLPCVHQAAL